MVNISSIQLNDTEYKVLSKGLSFCPSAAVDWFQLDIDLMHFFRNLHLKVWAQDQQRIQGISTSNCELELSDFSLYKKSEFNPPINSCGIDTFRNLVKRDLLKLILR